MKLVVLDGYTLNPGDLSWEQLLSLGNCDIYERTAPHETVIRAQGAEIILTNKTVLGADIIAQLPNLKYIGVLATGYNVVDVNAAIQHGITVTNVPNYGTASVAQFVFALMLNFCHHTAEHSTSVRQGRWSQNKDFCFWDYSLIELSGLTMGIVGLGRIGSSVADMAQAFGMNIIAYNPSTPPRLSDHIVLTDLKSVFCKSDVVSLHCPLTRQNEKFVNEALLSLMKPNAFLINTSRGGLIDEVALADALNRGTIAGAGLDVLTKEPANQDNPLLKAKNCIITPHIAWATGAARKRLMETAINNVKSFLQGKTVNAVGTSK